MNPSLNILMAQIDLTVGAIETNTAKIINIIKKNQSEHDMIVFPELAITGYPPEDLLLRDTLYKYVSHSLEAIQQATQDCYIVVGHPSYENAQHYNAASIFYQQKIISCYHKQHLPNYGVFDEARYFTPGSQPPCLFSVKTHQIGLCICEDLWQPGPADALIAAGADTILCINASPFEIEKLAQREEIARQYAAKNATIVYINQVGAQDELVFDGQSFVMDNTQEILVKFPAFQEHLEAFTIEKHNVTGRCAKPITQEASIYQALVTGLRDYVKKNGFPGVVLGLSGGIDSALSLAIAIDALGAEKVHALFMPSRYTSKISEEEALKQAKHLNVSHTTLSIEPLFSLFLQTLEPSFQGLEKGTTEENIQARIRGVLLMAWSNKHGFMVLNTSNKSETAVGYTTIYGDMVGGFAVLKDVLKTQVYQLANYRNQLANVIPERVITRPPSAELAANQTDQDNLPDYETLDAIITLYMEYNLSAEQISRHGHDSETVRKIIRLISANEYKRYQAPPGIKISARAFGRDWRYPITSGFHP